jgi:hypothetical protein
MDVVHAAKRCDDLDRVSAVVTAPKEEKPNVYEVDHLVIFAAQDNLDCVMRQYRYTEPFALRRCCPGDVLTR